jgi:hypothetical protein
MAQGQKLTGVQSLVLNMMGGQEGIQRLVKDLLGGIDPMQVFTDLKGSFDGIGTRLDRLDERVTNIALAIAANNRRNDRSEIGGNTAAAAGDRELAGAGSQPVADVGSGPVAALAVNGTGTGHADTGIARQQSGKPGVEAR